jgi:hypothetical protein
MRFWGCAVAWVRGWFLVDRFGLGINRAGLVGGSFGLLLDCVYGKTESLGAGMTGVSLFAAHPP